MHPVLQSIFISFVSAGGIADAESTGACVETLARGAPVDPIARSHEDLVRELDELIRANDRECEENHIAEHDPIPLFLQRAAE